MPSFYIFKIILLARYATNLFILIFIATSEETRSVNSILKFCIILYYNELHLNYDTSFSM